MASSPELGTTEGYSFKIDLKREQFSELLNCISDTTDGIDFHCCYTDEMMVSVNEVNECISRLECNKACGLDGVSAEHLKHYSSRITPLLAMCITGFMVHVFFLPESMMSVVLIPIIKDKKAKISSIDNYRPVAIASVVSKVVERILLDRLSEYLDILWVTNSVLNQNWELICVFTL